MAKSDGSVIIDTRMNTSGFQTGVTNMKKGFDGLGSAIGKIGKLMLIVFSAKQLIQFGKEAIELGSDLSEVQNVVDVTFGNLNEEINEFAKNAIEQFGLSETAAKQYTSTMGAMLKSMGFTTREAADMSKTMTGLAADMASFYNLNAEDAFYKIRAGISGETEPLKQLGINLNVANLEQYALTQGITKSYNAMTQQEQAMLRYNYLLKVTADAQGDFARTSDSWANQTRILSERFKALKATIGQGLINVFTPVIRVINTLLEKLATVANAFKAFTELITGKKSSGTTSKSSAGLSNSGITSMEDTYDSAASGAEDYADATEDAADATKKANKANKTYLSGLDEVQRYSEDITDALQSQADTNKGLDELPGANIGDAIDYGSLAEGETVIDKLNDKFLRLRDILSGLFKPFKDAWAAEGQGVIDAASTALANIGELARSVGKSIYDVWTNGTGTTMLSTVLQIVQNILDTVGNLAISFSDAWNTAGVGTGIVQALASGFQIILDFINRIALATSQWAGNLNFYPLLLAIRGLTESFLPVLQSLFSFFSSVYQSIILPIAKYLIEVAIPSILNGITTLFNFLSEHQWIIESVGALLLSAFSVSTVGGLISKITQLVLKLVKAISGGKGLLSGLSLVVSALGGPVTVAIIAVIAAGVLLYKNWDKICEAAGKLKDWVVKKTVELKDSAVDAFKTLAENVTGALKVLWESVKEKIGWIKEKFDDFRSFLSGVFERDWSQSFGTIGNVMNIFFDGIQRGWDSAKSIFGGIIDFIYDVFSGNWRGAWDYIKSIFISAFEGLQDLIKSPINAVISVVNNAISFINNAISGVESAFSFGPWEIPTPFGKKTIGFSAHFPRIPNVPYLAKGAVIPPNAPFAAVLGDQKQGNNIEAPEALLRKIVREELSGVQQGGNNTYTFVGQINRRTLFEEMMDEAQLVRHSTGRNPFEMA